MPTGDVLKLSVEGKFGGEPTVVDFGFISGSGLGSFEEESDSLQTEFVSALGLGSSGGLYPAPLSEQYSIDAIRVQDINPGLSAGRVFSLGTLGGNTTDDALPPNCALCLTWRDGLKGKAHRGRSYLTGFAEDSQNAGYWIPEIQAWASSIASAIMAQFGPLGAGNYTFAIIHTQSGGVRLVPPTATAVTSFTVNNTVRAIRRRSVGTRISRHRLTGP